MGRTLETTNECPDLVLDKIESMAYEVVGRGVPDICTVLSVLHLAIRVGRLEELAKNCIMFHREQNLDQLEDELEEIYESGVEAKV